MICFAGDYVEKSERFSVVFIGGPWNHETREMVEYHPYFEVPVSNDREELDDIFSPFIRPGGMKWTIFRYEAQLWFAGQRRFVVYVPQGTSPADTMQRLLNTYVSEKAEARP